MRIAIVCLGAAIASAVPPALGFLDGSVLQAQGKKVQKAKTRQFLFTYNATLTKIKPGQKTRLWLPYPPTTPHQKIKVAFTKFPPGAVVKKTKGEKYGNQFWYIEAKANSVGLVPVQIVYRVRREEVLQDEKTKGDSSKINGLFMKGNKLVPVGGKPAEKLLSGKKLPNNEFALAQQIYGIVNQHMKYNKPKKGPQLWGRGDAAWACDSRYGNCTDFHSLFISLVRTKKVAAKFSMGVPLPVKRGIGAIGGYHCWAWFKAEGRGWLPVDISAANRNPKKAKYFFGNLTENRIVFSTGRDIVFSPRQSGPPVNFFIYPYAEVNGKVHPAASIRREFTYQDVSRR